MKVAYFVGNQDELARGLVSVVKKGGFDCFTTLKLDELDQGGKQTKKICLMFCDSDFALKFLKKNHWSDFATYHILYLPQKPNLNPAMESKLKEVRLNVFWPENQMRMLEAMDQFISSPQLGEEGFMEEIEFAVHKDLEKKL